MYYDPMISKLITWGKDREAALNLIDTAFDQYVVQGVAHNIGFGKSIIHNEAFRKGDYSTSFIPEYYPEGYSGDNLTNEKKHLLALAAHKLKNIFSNYNAFGSAVRKTESQDPILYVTIIGKGEEEDHDWRVESDGVTLKVTDLGSENEEYTYQMNDFDFTHNSLIKMDIEGQSDHTL